MHKSAGRLLIAHTRRSFLSGLLAATAVPARAQSVGVGTGVDNLYPGGIAAGGGGASDPFFASVILLCHFDGTNGSTSFTDVSNSAHALAATNVTVSTTNPKFGTGCASYTTGAGNRVIAVGGAASDFNLGAGKFTVEAWGYFPASITGFPFLSQYGPGQRSWFLGITGTGQLALVYDTDGVTDNVVGAAYTPATNTWIHFAADRDASNVIRVYANGVVIASATAAVTFFASTAACNIGSDGYSDFFNGGFIDEVRVTKGVARYGGAFTPPSAPFPNH